MSQQSEISKSKTSKRIITSGDAVVATVDITLDSDSPEKNSTITIVSSDESPEKRPNKRAHNVSTELSTSDNQKKRKLTEDQSAEASTSNANNGNDNGQDYEDFYESEADDDEILARCDTTIVPETSANNSDRPAKSNVVTITSDEDESDDELSTDSDDDPNITNRLYTFYGHLDIAKKLKKRSITIANEIDNIRQKCKNFMEERHRMKRQLQNKNNTGSDEADNETKTPPPDPGVLNEAKEKTESTVDLDDGDSQPEMVDEVAVADTAEVLMTIDETEKEELTVEEPEPQVIDGIEDPKTTETIDPLPVKEAVSQNVENAEIVEDPKSADNVDSLPIRETDPQSIDNVKIPKVAAEFDSPPVGISKDGSQDAEDIENPKLNEEIADVGSATKPAEKSSEIEMEVDEIATTSQTKMIPNQEPSTSSKQENGRFNLHMENNDDLMFTTEDVYNLNVNILFSEYGNDEGKFKETLKQLELSNNEEALRLEHQWNKRLHIKFKIQECLGRLKRRDEIMSRDNLRKTSSASEEGDKTSKKPVTVLTPFSSMEDNKAIAEAVLKKANRIIARSQEKQYASELGHYDDSSSYSTSKSSTSYLGRGRQGTIKTVDSIIADHRQKYPYDVPRRGRRIKNNYNDINEPQHSSMASSLSEPQMSMQQLDQQSTSFPEVSLIRVPHQQTTNNTIDNRANANATASRPSTASSLLLNILSSKPNTTCSPTLARLLTAPERGIQNVKQVTSANNASKFHNNREITITPIAATQNYQDDDDDNSNDRLVIDEGDDDMAKFSRNRDSLMCQGCNNRTASFLCSGCNRQWYCSRQCQIDAWDEHSDVCSG